MAADIGFLRGYYCPLTYNDSRAVSGTSFPVKCQDQAGLIRWQIDATSGLKAYRFVAVGSGSANVASGNIVVYTDAYKLAVDTRVAQATRNAVAGVGIGTITAGNYGWIQVYGATTLTLKGGVTAADGDAIIMSDTDKLADQVTMGTAPTHQVIGYATAAGSGAGGTVATFLNCL